MSEFEEELKSMKDIDDNVGIYAVGCKVAKIVYIGESTDIRRRLSQHKRGLISRSHSNKGFQNAVFDIGIDSLVYEILQNCPRHLLKEIERHYIQLFKSYGYIVFGDNDTSNKFRAIEDYIGYSKYEGKYLAKFNERYLIILKAYKDTIFKNKIINEKLNDDVYTNYLVHELLEGIEKYKVENDYIKGILNPYFKSDAEYTNSTLNYVAFNIFKSIHEDEEWYEKNIFGGGEIFKLEQGQYYQKTIIDMVILDVKNRYDLNNDLLKVLSMYSFRALELEKSDIIYITNVFANSGKIKMKNVFDFLYYYILIIYCRKIVAKYYLL